MSEETIEVSSPRKAFQLHHKSRGKARKLSHAIVATSSLRDTLQAFGDDVIKVKDPSKFFPTRSQEMAGMEENEGGSVNPSFSADFDFDLLGGRKEKSLRFERVSSAEIGVRSARWKKAMLAGLVASKLSKKNEAQDYNSDMDDTNLECEKRPPFWGVRADIRNKLSILNLQLLLHEMACFASCVLLGCLIVKALETISGGKSVLSTSEDEHWIFSRMYGSVTSFLLVFTSLGFLTRIDTVNSSSLLTSPFLLIPIILLAGAEYLNKAWDLQKHECLNYLKLDEASKSKVYLTQDCNSYKISIGGSAMNEQQSNIGTSPPSAIMYFMRICPVVICSCVSLFLFIFRNNFYLINQFVSSNVGRKNIGVSKRNE